MPSRTQRAEQRRVGRVTALASAVVWLLLHCFSPAHASSQTGNVAPPGRERPAAGGRLAWVLGGELDMLGDLWVDVPFPVGERDSVYFSLDTRTAIQQPTSGFAFQVRDLLYDFELGWRARRLGRNHLFAFGGQIGDEAVDADGQAFVQYLGLGVESSNFRAYRVTPRCDGPCGWAGRFDWRVSGGPVVDEREVEADLVLQAEARFWVARTGLGGSSLGLDFELNGLVGDGSLDADVAAGPRLSFPAGTGRRASFYLYYHDGGNPLGLGKSFWLLGFGYDEGTDARRPSLEAPAIDGRLAAGGGEGRTAGQLRMRFLSPPFARETRAVAVVDGNILTADDTGELYYSYYLGLERPIEAILVGGYFHHRSNHQLAEPNDRVTSINVLEAGLETRRWQRPASRAPGRRWGRLDGLARVGYLLNSTFGEDRRWHLRGGVRWSLPGSSARPVPYLSVELETGDVVREKYAAGVGLVRNLELQLEYLKDEQYFGKDQTAVLLIARYWF